MNLMEAKSKAYGISKRDSFVCRICNKKSTLNNLCKLHFIKDFETKVYSTIKKYNLIPRKKKILVAASGGKDSQTVLYLLNKKYDVQAIAIDEGIEGYRDRTLGDLRNFCKKNNINLKVVSFKKETGHSLDEILKIIKVKPCSACGILRRYYLNRENGFDLMATGHNMDDEAQSFLMNLFKNQPEMSARLGPKTGVVRSRKFLQRIKPLYFCTEKEVAAYAFLKKFQVGFAECPNAKDSFRADVRDMLLRIEHKNPGFRKNILNNFLRLASKNKFKIPADSINDCKKCGEPTNLELCSACTLLLKING